MSKKKKKKYYQQAVNNVTSSVNNTANAVSTGISGVISSTVSPMTPVKAANSDKQAAFYNAHAEEYAMVRHDLIRVALVNGVFLAAVLALYYANRSHPFLEIWYTKLIG